MYRLNFYREFHARRQESRRRASWTAVAAVFVGVEIVIVGVLLLSSFLLGGQTKALKGEMARIMMRIQEVSAPTPELETARELLELRRGRIDWSPKLATVSWSINRLLRLESLVGQISERGRPPRLVLGGVIRGSADPAAPVARFMDELRSDPRIAVDLPEVRLGAMDASDLGESRFQIICEAKKVADGQ